MGHQPAVVISLVLCFSATHVVASDISEAFDVIIVGSGTAGSTAAKVLSDDPNISVLVLEGGSSGPGVFGIDDENTLGPPFQHTDKLSKFDVPGWYNELAVPCYTNCTYKWDTVPGYQPKLIGGAGVANGALVMWPQPQDFDEYPDNWKWDDVEGSFFAVRDYFRVASGTSRNEPWTQHPSRDRRHYGDDHAGLEEFKTAMRGLGVVEDLVNNEWTGIGRNNCMGIPFVSTDENSVRTSPATVFLFPNLDRPNLELRINATVTDLLYDHAKEKVDGVTYRDSSGQEQNVGLTPGGRVILAAGGLNTPHLLLKAGLGAKNPHIGETVFDHPLGMITYQLDDIEENTFLSPENVGTYEKSMTGLTTQYGPTFVAHWNTPDLINDPSPMIEYFSLPGFAEHTAKVYFFLFKVNETDVTYKLGYNTTSGHLTMDGDIGPANREVMQTATNVFVEGLEKQGIKVTSNNPYLGFGNHWLGSVALGSAIDPETLTVKGTTNLHAVDGAFVPHNVPCHPWLSISALSFEASKRIASSMGAKRSSDARIAVFGNGIQVFPDLSATNNCNKERSQHIPVLGHISFATELNQRELVLLNDARGSVMVWSQNDAISEFPLQALKSPSSAVVIKDILHVICENGLAEFAISSSGLNLTRETALAQGRLVSARLVVPDNSLDTKVLVSGTTGLYLYDAGLFTSVIGGVSVTDIIVIPNSQDILALTETPAQLLRLVWNSAGKLVTENTFSFPTGEDPVSVFPGKLAQYVYTSVKVASAAGKLYKLTIDSGDTFSIKDQIELLQAEPRFSTVMNGDILSLSADSLSFADYHSDVTDVGVVNTCPILVSDAAFAIQSIVIPTFV